MPLYRKRRRYSKPQYATTVYQTYSQEERAAREDVATSTDRALAGRKAPLLQTIVLTLYRDGVRLSCGTCVEPVPVTSEPPISTSSPSKPGVLEQLPSRCTVEGAGTLIWHER